MAPLRDGDRPKVGLSPRSHRTGFGTIGDKARRPSADATEFPENGREPRYFDSSSPRSPQGSW